MLNQRKVYIVQMFTLYMFANIIEVKGAGDMTSNKLNDCCMTIFEVNYIKQLILDM